MSIAKYPVQVGDDEGIVDAVNYVLSGPAGLGQNFAGFSTYLPAYLRPTFRQPFVTPITNEPTPLFSQIPCNDAFGCDENGTPVGLTSTLYVLYQFTTPFASPPFVFGDRIFAGGFTPNDYDSSTYYGLPSSPSLVFACTNTYVIIKYNGTYSYPPYVSGGYVGFNRLNQKESTDCNGRVTVTGGTDRVFVSGQLLCDIDYNSTIPNSEFDVTVSIERLTGYVNNNPGATDYTFDEPITTVAERRYHYSVTGNGTITDLETIFAQFIDGPDIPFGYYWYLLQFTFTNKPRYKTSYAIGGVENLSLSGTSVSQIASYTGLLPTTVTGSGSGFDLDLDIDTTNTTNYDGSVTIVTFNNVGTGYQVGDILSIPGTSLGGASPANDMTMTITQIVYPGDATAGVVTLGLRSLTAQVVKQ